MSLRLRFPGGVPVGAGTGASFRDVVDPTDGEGEAGVAVPGVFLFDSVDAADVSEPLKAARWLSRYEDDIVAVSQPAEAAASALKLFAKKRFYLF